MHSIRTFDTVLHDTASPFLPPFPLIREALQNLIHFQCMGWHIVMRSGVRSELQMCPASLN